MLGSGPQDTQIEMRLDSVLLDIGEFTVFASVEHSNGVSSSVSLTPGRFNYNSAKRCKFKLGKNFNYSKEFIHSLDASNSPSSALEKNQLMSTTMSLSFVFALVPVAVEEGIGFLTRW